MPIDTNVEVYVDEYERDGVFMLGAIIVPKSSMLSIIEDWNELRRKVKFELIEGYYLALTHPKLQEDLLPEIHAVELFQSDGYYRKYPRGQNQNDKYWLRHYEWLEDSLKIIQKHKIRFMSLPVEPSQMPIERNLYQVKRIASLARGSFPEQEVVNLLKNKYLYTLPLLLFEVENLLEQERLFGKVVCDEYELSSDFKKSEIIDWIVEKGYYNKLSKPEFVESTDNPLLQVSDVICYIRGRVNYVFTNSGFRDVGLTEIDDMFINWDKQYLESLEIQPKLDIDIKLSIVIVWEIVFKKAIKDRELKSKLLDIIRGVIN